jgi:hypothetical protein
MINAQLRLFIVKLGPQQINVLADNNAVPCSAIETYLDIDYQIIRLYKKYFVCENENFINFRYIDIDTEGETMYVSYLVVVSTAQDDPKQGTYQPLGSISNEYNYKTVQKLKRIL